MLQESDIACHQRRRRKAKHLPERKIPRHHRQNRTDRQIPDEAFLGSSIYYFVRQEPLCIVRVVPACSRALGRFRHGGLIRLAHLQGHQPTKASPESAPPSSSAASALRTESCARPKTPSPQAAASVRSRLPKAVGKFAP